MLDAVPVSNVEWAGDAVLKLRVINSRTDNKGTELSEDCAKGLFLVKRV